MHRQLFLLLLCCFTSLSAFNQDSTLQSLLSARDDTGKVLRLLSHTRKLVNNDVKKAHGLSTYILQLSNRLHYDKGIGTATLFLGVLELNAGKFERSKSFFHAAITYFQKAGDGAGVSKCLINLGKANNHIGLTDSGIYYQTSAIRFIESRRDTASLGVAYINLAVSYANNFDDWEKALLYYQRAEVIARKAKDTMYVVGALAGKSSMYYNKKNAALALSNAGECVALAKLYNDFDMLGMAYDHFAAALKLNGDLPASVEASKLSLKYAGMINNVDNMLRAYVTLSETLKEQKDFKEEIRILSKALTLSKDAGDALFARDIYKNLADAHYATGNYKQAYESYNQSVFYKDSAVKEKNNRVIAEFEAKYQTEKNERALAQKELQLQKSRQLVYGTLGGLLIVLLLTGLLYFNFRHRKKAHQRELYTLQQQKEIQLLQAVMQGEERERSRIAKDLHDGVAGMLAAVKMHFGSVPEKEVYTETEGYRKGIRLLDEATQEVRKTSHNLMPELLVRHGLDEALKRYCSNVTGSQLVVQYDSWGEMKRYKISFELSVYRIVQELLNNILKHSRATQAIVQMNRQNSMLSITVEDNGMGLGAGSSTGGMGFEHLHSRIKAMNGHMEVASSPDSGVSAYLEFDVTGLEEEVVKDGFLVV